MARSQTLWRRPPLSQLSVAVGLPDAVSVGLFLIPVPYILTAVVGVVRSANRYQGPPMWAGSAKVAVIMWGAAVIVI